MRKRLMKKMAAVGLASAMVLGMAACGNSGDKNSNTPAPDASASEEAVKPAADGDSYKVIVNLTWPAESEETKTIKAGLEDIESATEGRLTFEVYDSGSLVGIMDTFKGAQDGLCDITFMPNNIAYDYLPLNGRLLTMPMMGYTSIENANAVYNQIRQEYPEVDTELEQYGLVNLGAFYNGAADFYFAKSVGLSSLSDIKGFKIGNSDKLVNDIVNSIGTTGVNVTTADAYTSLDNGVVDGLVQHPLFFRVTGCTDIIKEVVKIGDTGVTRQDSMFIMNKNAYDRLPEDLQEALKTGFAQIVAAEAEVTSNSVAGYEKALADKGAVFTVLDDSVSQPIRDKASEIQKTTIEELEGQGVKAQEIYDRVQELIQENQ